MRKQIENKVKELGYELGCYSKNLDNILTKKALNQILNRLDEDYTDLFIRIRRKLYVVSIATVDNEKDVVMYSDKEYFGMFGNLDDALDEGIITKAEYNKLRAWC